MELERSFSIISDPIRFVLERETEAELEGPHSLTQTQDSVHGSRISGSASASPLFSVSKGRDRTRTHARGGKVKAVGGTSTINSSHYVDFCTDPTTGFPEFQPTAVESQSQSQSQFLSHGVAADKMPGSSSWTHLPPFEVEREAESQSQSRVILHGTPTTTPGSNGHRHTPLPPRTTTLHPSVSSISPEPLVRCLQGPSCPHCITLGPSGPYAPPPRGRTVAARSAPNAFSSTSFSLRPWQWPRRVKPVKPQRDENDPSGSRLFFTAPYRYFGFGRGRTATNGGTIRPSPLTRAKTPANSSSSSSRPTSTSTDCSSSSFGSSASQESHSSAPRSLPSCEVHSPIRIRPTATTMTSYPAAAPPYYYLQKYGTRTRAGGLDDDDTAHTAKDSWYSSAGCCKKIKYKCHKNSAPTMSASAWPSWPWSNYGYSNGGSGNGKRRAQALRAFQLICMMLCILGIATVLVITILASLAKSVRTTDLYVGGDGDGDIGRMGVGVSLVDDLLVSNAGADIEPEDLPVAYKKPAASIRELLKAWLLENSGLSGAPAVFEEEEDAQEMKPDHDHLLNVTNFRFLLNNEEMCQQQTYTNSTSASASANARTRSTATTFTPDHDPDSSTPSKLYFMILVHSAPKHFQQRQAIRSTWGSVKSFKNLGIRLAFLLGQPANESPASNSSTIKFTRNNPADLLQRSIQSEQALYGDIVQGNFPDTYHNLIYKHLMGYKWVLQFCDGQSTTFVLKCDDDAFVDIFQLIDFTTRHYGLQPNGPTIICNVYEGTFPIRAPKAVNSSSDGLSKWTVTRDEYPLAMYPKYCGGLAYLITPDVIRDLVQVHEQIMAHLQASNRSLQFWIDDVYVTGVLRELAGREPYYMNLRYAYDTKLYHPWMLNDHDHDHDHNGVIEGSSSSSEPSSPGTKSNVVSDPHGGHDKKHALHKIPYMIVHLEQTGTLSEEMNRLWRKTMRVWH